MKLTSLAALCACAVMGSSHAAIAFDNYGPGNAVNGSSGWAVGTISPTFMAVQADRFVSQTTGTLSAINFNFGGQGSQDFSLAVSVWSEHNTGFGAISPETLLASTTVPVFRGSWSNPAAYTTATFADNVNLVANTAYWVVFQTVDPAQFGALAWNVAGTGGGRAFSPTNPPTNWLPYDLTTPQSAFRVTVSAVPEPASAWLLAGGALFVVMRTRRRALDGR